MGITYTLGIQDRLVATLVLGLVLIEEEKPTQQYNKISRAGLGA